MKILMLILLIIASPGLGSAEESYGLLMIVKGQVQIVKQKTAPVNAKVGGKVFPQDTIVTGKDSRAKIVMHDRNIINVLPETKLRIDQYISNLKEKNVRLSLLEGKVRANVEQKYDDDENKFEIRTPSAVAGVRGTQFMTSYKRSTNMTGITTFRGEVSFRGLDTKSNKMSDPVLVKKGESSENVDGKAPGTPVKLNPVELKKVEGESVVKKEERPQGDSQQAGVLPPPPKNEISQITDIRNRNDNLLGDSAKNIINKPAKVNIIIE
jgi:hypothetical protein